MFTAGAFGQESDPCGKGGQTCYFAIEINNVLCGYSTDNYCNAVTGGKNIRYENSDVYLKMKVLGAEMSGRQVLLFSEQMLHQLGHKLLKDNRIDDAVKIFARNVEEYPGSFMTNDALAEAYLEKGEKESALKYFRKAVKLDPGYEYGKTMIEKLRKN